MQILTRRATPADAEILSEISKKTFYDTFTGTCTEKDMQLFLETYFNPEQVKQELSDPNDQYHLALIDGEVAGYTRFMEDNTSFPHMNKWKSLELKRIYVYEKFQGKGVAQVLMNLVLEYAMENRYEVVYLGVWEHNKKAQKFYKKFGFVDSGYTHDFPIGDTPQMDIWMWKFL